MGTTPLHALPYPELTDPADAHKGYQDLANAVDPLLLPTTTIVAAATRIVANLLAATDTQPAFRIMGDGRLDWGAGGSAAPDASLYRSAAGQLTTQGLTSNYLYVNAGSASQMLLNGGYLYFGNANDTYLYRRAGNVVGTVGSFASEGALTGWGFQAYVSGEAQPRSYLRNDATLLFGPGGSTPDTNLYRSGAGTLKTDGGLQVAKTIYAAMGPPGNGFVHYAPTLVGYNAFAVIKQSDAAYTWQVSDVGTISWGPGGSTNPDTNLYRSAAATLRSDGHIVSGYNGYLVGAGNNSAARQIRAGSSVVNVDGGTNATITFESAFPTACLGVVAINGNVGAATFSPNLVSKSVSGFVIRCSGASPGQGVQVEYFAWGY